MITEGDGDDGDLEAELAEITGVKAVTKSKSKEKMPLPMDHIKQMAEECMKDVDENDDDDDDFENDEELLAELKDVVGDEEEESSNSSFPTDTPVSIKQQIVSQPQSSTVSMDVSGLQGTLEERIQMYRVAINNAKQTGETSKMRRYERGLKTLQTMLASAKKGKMIEEAEIPPPVATGKSSAPVLQPDSLNAESLEAENVEGRVAEMLEETPISAKPVETVLPAESSVPESHNVLEKPATTIQSEISDVTTAAVSDDGTGSDDSKTKALLIGRQKEYKLAALRAKQQGDITTALEYVKISKKFAIAIKALHDGEPVDLSNLPSSLTDTSTQDKSPGPSSTVTLPDQQEVGPKTEPQGNIEAGTPPPPRDILEALHQRMERYKTAATQAKANGNDRKARMHERIAKQYQDAIRAHKAGRKVDFGDLPVPPGFPAIPGVGGTSGDIGISGTLQAASRLAAAEVEVEEDDDESGTPQSAAQPPVAKRPTKLPDHVAQTTLTLPAATEERQSPKPIKKPLSKDHLTQQSTIEQQQLEFLQNRKKQYMKAALQAKQKDNLEQAKHFLRTAKGFDPLILAVQNGKPVDISKVPSPPEDEESDNDFIIVHHKDAQISPKIDEVYTYLTNMLKEQYEKCMTYSKQFTHLGNVVETTKFEKMAVDCKKNLEILKLGQAQGLDPPKYHFEERTFKTVRIFSDISSTEMFLFIVKGINLPAPSGVAAHDLDAFVKFEFQYPSTEQAQRNKTAVIKNTNCPEYNESFVLNINRNHRGFKRVIQTKGIKFEVFHKGGFFRSDKPVGTAQLKLDKLETECEVREIVEIFDGRKSTGGRLELKVKIREPLNGQDMQTTTENWLILDPTTRSNHDIYAPLACYGKEQNIQV
ncbi:coiled-coil and C2 domain-containing protein 1B isoform X2 [Pristis pectinata]|uniref:coiled-coil and C2 domain-containing protein 1B isoform X2 n=1 Tax=Pristis pectinata TaxID=685728 RepID=UPI00223D597B|nr:coiled-coil and C2 domain-containing protein 1B isoform X2 [Pristis pectinata]